MKRLLRMTLMAMALVLVLCGSALAEEQRSLDAGFYGIDIGTAKNVTVTAMKADGTTKAPGVAADVDGSTATYYEGAARLAVTYSGAVSEGDQFLVLLVEGDTLPTVGNAIWYIDQVAGSSGSIKFDVYPTLTDKSEKQLSLYITSNSSDFDKPIKISLNYAPANTYKEAPYTLGDVNMDNAVDPLDSMEVLQYSAGLIDLTSNQVMAANVTKALASSTPEDVVDPIDAMRILQYSADILKTWDQVL